MYHKKNIDFVALLWEDLAFQIDNKDFKKQEKMYYPRFTKAIIHYFLTKDKSILMRNKMFMHTAQDDSILESPAYKTYFAFATGETTPKPKRIYKKTASPIIKTLTTSPKETPSKKKIAPAKKDKKAPVTTDKSKGIELLSKATLLEDAQMKKVLKRSKKETHSHDASGSGDGVDQSESEDESWRDSGDDDISNDVDDDVNSNDGDNDASDDVRTESDDDKNEMIKKKSMKKKHKEEWTGDKEKIDTGHDAVTQETTYKQVKDDEHVTLTTIHVTQKMEVPLQSSSIASDFATQFLNLDNPSPPNTEINSMMNIDVRHEEPSTQTPLLLTIPVMVIPKTSSTVASTIPPLIPLFTPLPQPSTSTPTPNPTPTTEATTSIPALLDFSSLFRFN
ncbi:hypothetical protein Tco_0858497 [Tanacetum coccineum]|uniref:Uncharacterized protein n=1 Tax=Tanacetum coccineum TaxID=301880 RepID=A0ABQ5B9E6_9ASTR